MSLDHRDEAAVDAFTDEVDRHLGGRSSGLEPWAVRLLAAWAVAGVLITLAVRTDGVVGTALYLAGFAAIAIWVTGFLPRARRRPLVSRLDRYTTRVTARSDEDPIEEDVVVATMIVVAAPVTTLPAHRGPRPTRRRAGDRRRS